VPDFASEEFNFDDSRVKTRPGANWSFRSGFERTLKQLRVMPARRVDERDLDVPFSLAAAAAGLVERSEPVDLAIAQRVSPWSWCRAASAIRHGLLLATLPPGIRGARGAPACTPGVLDRRPPFRPVPPLRLLEDARDPYRISSNPSVNCVLFVVALGPHALSHMNRRVRSAVYLAEATST